MSERVKIAVAAVALGVAFVLEWIRRRAWDRERDGDS